VTGRYEGRRVYADDGAYEVGVDVVAFDSPANPGPVEPGDELAVTDGGIGTLRNTVE